GFNQQNQSLRLDSVAWISLNGGIIIRNEISLVQEALVDAPAISAPTGGPGGFGGGTGNRPGGPTANPGGASTAGAGVFVPVYDPQRDEKGNWSVFSFVQQQTPPSGPPPGFRPPGLPPGARIPGGFPGGPGGQTGFGGPQQQQTQQTQQPRPAGRQIIRVSLNAVIELER
ncbi:MAG: hypothetical protein ABUL72_04180, partial [Armatimonadota bacterium]